MPRRVGILGMGHLGRFLVRGIEEQQAKQQQQQSSAAAASASSSSDNDDDDQLEVAFVWNRTPLADVAGRPETSAEEAELLRRLEADGLVLPPAELTAAGVAAFLEKKEGGGGGVDLMVEVAHPQLLQEHGAWMLGLADVFAGSPTCFADAAAEASLRAAAGCGGGEDDGSGGGTKKKKAHALYVPAGALWGAVDIAKMADRGTLSGIAVTMKKHPGSFKLGEPLLAKLEAYKADDAATGECVLYDGPVRALCPLAPNNVNTMACAAIAAHNVGFDEARARLIADKSLEAHVIDIDVFGPKKADGSEGFAVRTTRVNPAAPGAVTGSATYVSFLSSLFKAKGKKDGLHFC